MPYIRSFAVIATVISISGCVVNNVPATTTPIKSAAVFEEAKLLAAERMRDPEAARFKPQYTAYKTNVGDNIVCGTMNGKNAMGGYVGYRPFWIRIRDGKVMSFEIPGEDDEYGYLAQTIKKSCAEASSGNIMLMN